MQILKKAKGNAGEIVPWNADKKDVHAEVLRRNAKAGYCTRYGECADRSKIMTMPLTKKGEANYRRAFGHD